MYSYLKDNARLKENTISLIVRYESVFNTWNIWGIPDKYRIFIAYLNRVNNSNKFYKTIENVLIQAIKVGIVRFVRSDAHSFILRQWIYDTFYLLV